MGKVVKYCSACEEGFAEKFGFCPNCGSNLQAFEMNPLGGISPEAKPAADVTSEPVITAPPAPSILENRAEPVNPPVAETNGFSADAAQPAETSEAFESSDEVFEEPAAETKKVEAAQPAKQDIEDNLYQATYAKAADKPAESSAPYYVPDTGYSPTIVVEKNVKERNSLLLGFFVLGVVLMVGSYVYSMFNKFLDIAAIDTPDLLAYVGEVDPTPLEEEPPPPKEEKKDAGGGGGGGKDEPTPASKGREATQVDKPLFPPSSSMDRVTNPAIPIQMATKGNKKAEMSDEPYGLRDGADGRSDGYGTGGGLGNGRGTGQGNGEGEGLGNGKGSGYGNGNGNGNGNGTGDGDPSDKIAVKTKPVGPTVGVQILSKPRANYTDAARQNQVQGKVVLRVTFSANGTIGGISVISGLGNGLTEQAIAAARGIKFEPAKRGGVPYSVTKPVEYSFTIY